MQIFFSKQVAVYELGRRGAGREGVKTNKTRMNKIQQQKK